MRTQTATHVTLVRVDTCLDSFISFLEGVIQNGNVRHLLVQCPSMTIIVPTRPRIRFPPQKPLITCLILIAVASTLVNALTPLVTTALPPFTLGLTGTLATFLHQVTQWTRTTATGLIGALHK